MGPLQRAPGPPPTAFGQDPPRLHRRERTSLVKNRMREICTSGSVRGEGGNILTYSAARLCERGEERRKRLGAAARSGFEHTGRRISPHENSDSDQFESKHCARLPASSTTMPSFKKSVPLS